MKTIDYSYFIEKYNAGEMSDSEKKWFLKELDGSEKLRNEVKLRKLADEVLANQNILSLRTKLSAIEKRREADVLIRKPSYMKFAAVITALILIGSVAFFNGRNLTSDEIMNLYYKAYDFPTAQRSGQSETNTEFVRALEFYNEHEYEKAANLFNKVLESNPGDMKSVFLGGISNLGEKKYPEAKQSFVTVIDDNNNYFVEDAKWFLALCYVRTDEKERALMQLESIRKEGGIYSKKAKKIIRSFK